VVLIVFIVALAAPALAAEHTGHVTFNGLGVPGATVTASRSDERVVTATDERGVYQLDLPEGAWTISVEMSGFAPVSREVTVAEGASPGTWELTLLSFAEISVRLKPDTATTAVAPAAGAQQGFQRAGVTAPANVTDVPNVPNDSNGSNGSNDPLGLGAAEGLLINGSVNNGAASPFAQLRAFGNNRPGQRSLYNGGIGLQLGNSAFDARPFSFTTGRAPKPDYTDAQILTTFGGPFRIPGLTNRANLFVGYQRTADTIANTQSALMPTLLERGGNLSQTRDAFGRPVSVIDPLTGQPFPGNTIPRDRISPQAASLLRYYPQPTLDAADGFNYQTTVVNQTRQDSVQSRITQVLTPRSQLFGTFSYQRETRDSTNLFGFEDRSGVSGVDTSATWSYRLSQFLSLRLRYQFTQLTNTATPFFANRTNLSGEAGITGNNQDPENWGPPTLNFSSGIAGLTDGLHAFTRTRTNGWSAEWFSSRGRHFLTFGGGIRRHEIDVRSQQDPRGAFTFTGALTGSDLADFLLGVPRTSSIAFGNADKDFRAFSYDGFITDDWRISPSLTANIGIRWEYEAPPTERRDRLVNLDLTPGFTAATPVVADEGSLIAPDRRGFQPRLGFAWRPVPGSSLVIRGGYGIYRNTNVYQSIANLLAQQPPFSTAFTLENSVFTPLTLANGFSVPGAGSGLTTFAVDPNFRVGYAQNWQASLQRDFPASLTVIASYLGTQGSRLMQEILPNTYPAGAANPCPTCPAGFVYLTSNGESSRHAGQLQVRRRLRNGLTATTQYTYAQARDNAAAFGGASLSGASIAQDWLNPDAEMGPSNFDQRHLLTIDFQYTTGVGVGGGALVDGLRGALFKGWTITSRLTAGSGMPLTPVYLNSVRGVTGTIRADLTGAAVGAIPDGHYLNPAAYAPPAPGQWGTAARNSVTGPAQFGVNAGIARTFLWGDRLNLDWRIDATNVLNQVTYAGVNTLVGSPQFGLPNRANAMRKIQTTLRLRF
jgi:hypothetical protein